MRALRIAQSSPVRLVETDIPRPALRPGEVLIRVRAAGVTPTELLWFPTSHTRTGEPRTGAVPAHEFSGEIAETGAGTAGFSAGQPVYGMNDWFADGALAECCVTRAEWIAPKPETLSYAEAATVPIGALTAWQGLYDRARLQAGERVLIHGGAGAVGVFAIQLARIRGAQIITTVSARHAGLARTLGADRVIDYRASRFEDELRDVDVVFDAVGGETLERSWSVLKPHGRLVTIAASSEGAGDERVRQSFFIVEPKRSQLVEITRLLDIGKLRTVVDTRVPFSRGAAAYAGAIARHGRGKVVVLVDEAAAPIDARAAL